VVAALGSLTVVGCANTTNTIAANTTETGKSNVVAVPTTVSAQSV
jgi:hypothetical protein